MDKNRSELPGGLSNRDPFGKKGGIIGTYLRSFKKQQLKRYFVIFFLPTVAAFIIGFLIPFVRGLYLSFCEFRNINSAKFIGIQN